MIEFLPFEVASGKNVPDSAAGVKGGIATPKSGVVPKADFAESSRNDGVGALAMTGLGRSQWRGVTGGECLRL